VRAAEALPRRNGRAKYRTFPTFGRTGRERNQEADYAYSDSLRPAGNAKEIVDLLFVETIAKGVARPERQ